MGRTPSKRRKISYIESPRDTAIEILKYALIYLICIVYWEFLIYVRTQSTIKGLSLWPMLFAIPISIFAAALNGWSKSNYRRNRIVTAVIALVFCIYYGSDLIYFESFGSLFSVSMMGMGGDAITNFWWSLSGTILKNLPRLILYLLPVIFLFVYSFVPALDLLNDLLPHRGVKPVFHAAAVAGALICWILVVLLLPISGKSDASAYGVYHSKFVDTDTASQKLGALPNTLVELKVSIFGSGGDKGLEDEDGATVSLDDGETASPEEEAAAAAAQEAKKEGYNVYENLDFTDLAAKTEDADLQALCNYLNKVEPTNKNDYTGMFEGYNLIYICAESFSSYALNEKVTPNMCRLAREGIVLNNYYNGFKNTTTNGEFAMLTGLWPDVSRDANMGKAAGTMPQSATKNMFAALGNMFMKLGISPRAYHNYKGSYYSRNESWPNLGFDCTFADTGLTISSGWPGSDLEMFEQSVDKYIYDDQFCTYYMTFSGHGEYTEKNAIVKKNLSTVKELLGDDAKDLTDEGIAYLACNYETDLALGYLLDRLQETGKSKNTVIVMAADHYPYYIFTASRNAFAGHNVNKDWEMYKSTCIMWNGGIETPIQVDTPCDNVDILPTILNLFNIPYDSRLYAGVDIFSDATHVAQLYNKNFITDRVKYKAADAKATWLDENDTSTDEEKKTYLDSMINTVNKRYSASIAIEDTSFYDFVAANFDIPTPDLESNATAVANANAGAVAQAPASTETTAADTAENPVNTETPAAEIPAESAAAEGEEENHEVAAADETADIGEDGEMMEEEELGDTGDEPEISEASKENTDSDTKQGGFLGRLFKLILTVIFILVLLFVYVNRRYFRKRLRRYLKKRRRQKARRRYY